MLVALTCSACSGVFTLDDRQLREYDFSASEWTTTRFSIITMRDRWPTGVPLQIGVQHPRNFMHRERWRRLIVTPEFPWAASVELPLHPYSVMFSMAAVPWSPGLHDVGVLPDSATTVAFEINAQETRQDAFHSPRPGEPPIEWRKIKSATIVRAIRQVSTIDDAVAPNRDPELTRLISRDLALDFDQDRRELWWRFPPKALDYEIKWKDASPTPEECTLVAHTSIALRVSLQQDGDAVATSRFFISQANSFPGATIEGDLDRLSEEFANPEGWTIVIESDPEMALLDIENDRYWSGRFERPLSTVAIRPKPQPR